jgi:hypothetical protein
MKKSKFTESQIVFPLQGDSAGCRVRYNETELQRRMSSPVGRVMVRGSFLAHADGPNFEMPNCHFKADEEHRIVGNTSLTGSVIWNQRCLK